MVKEIEFEDAIVEIMDDLLEAESNFFKNKIKTNKDNKEDDK